MRHTGRPVKPWESESRCPGQDAKQNMPPDIDPTKVTLGAIRCRGLTLHHDNFTEGLVSGLRCPPSVHSARRGACPIPRTALTSTSNKRSLHLHSNSRRYWSASTRVDVSCRYLGAGPIQALTGRDRVHVRLRPIGALVHRATAVRTLLAPSLTGIQGLLIIRSDRDRTGDVRSSRSWRVDCR